MNVTKYQVTIQFTDGEYKNKVITSDSDRAYKLALIDARMASPFAMFSGSVVSYDVVAA